MATSTLSSGPEPGSPAPPPGPRVPRPLETAAGVAWRLLVVAAAVLAVLYVLVQLRLVVLPFLIALFVATLLSPPAHLLRRRGAPDALAAAVVLIGALLVIGGLVAVVAPPVAGEIDQLDFSLRRGVDRLAEIVAASPLNLSARQVDQSIQGVIDQVRDNSGVIARSLVSGAVVAAEVVAGILLALVMLFFFLKDGERMWAWAVDLFPRARRHDLNEMGVRAWNTLGGYLRGIAIVATADAVLIGIALAVIGVPLVLPLAVLTFVAAFFPLVGAVAAGAVAALVALVSKGVVAALLVVAAVTVIQQVEGDLLHPVVVGRTVSLHPVAILMALGSGAVLGGVIGAFLAVPVAASLNAMAGYLREQPTSGAGAGLEPDAQA